MSSGQSSGVVYASLQKDTNNFQHPTPDPWNESRSVANIACGPPPSLAEQLKQVRTLSVLIVSDFNLKNNFFSCEICKYVGRSKVHNFLNSLRLLI